MTIKHKEIIQAWLNGEVIEAKYLPGSNWIIQDKPNWYDERALFRIKPKLQYRNFTFKPMSSLDPNKIVVCVVEKRDQLVEPRETWQGFIEWLDDWKEV